jgi:hypothetical protein
MRRTDRFCGRHFQNRKISTSDERASDLDGQKSAVQEAERDSGVERIVELVFWAAS